MDGIAGIDGIQFDLTATTTHAEGLLHWNSEDGTLEVDMPGGVVHLQIGEETVLRVTNNSGVDMFDGDVVYVSGSLGSKPTIALADADSIMTSGVIGVLTEDIANNNNGFVATFGLVRDINTTTCTAGQPIWLSQTAGDFTSTRPAQPATGVVVGICLVSHATEGLILVKTQLVDRLVALSDVSISGQSDGDYIYWDNASSTWKAKAVDVYTGTAPVVVTGTDISVLNTIVSAGASDSGDLVKLDSGGKIDLSVIPAGAGSVGTTTINFPLNISFTTDKNTKGEVSNIHGGIGPIGTAEVISSGNPVNLTNGISKIMLVVNAGTDTAGDILIAGTRIDRDTRATTTATSTVTISGLTTDNTAVNGIGETVWDFTNAYISDNWYIGDITLSTTDTNLSDFDVYQIGFEQFNDEPNITITTVDTSFSVTNTAAAFSQHTYLVDVTGDTVDINSFSDFELTAAESEVKGYREREGNLNISIDGTQDGVFVDFYFAPTNQTYFENISSKIWGTVAQDVSANFVAGNDTEIQYNDSGVLGASSAMTWNNATGLFSATNGYFSGNVGVGTDSPDEGKLHIYESGAFTNGVAIAAETTGDEFATLQLENSGVKWQFSARKSAESNRFQFSNFYGGSWNDSFVITAGDTPRVGINTTSPASTLHISGSTTIKASIDSTAIKFIENNGSESYRMVIDGSGNLSFYADNGDERMELNDSSSVVSIQDIFRHIGDDNTYMRFNSDRIFFDVGDLRFLDMDEDEAETATANGNWTFSEKLTIASTSADQNLLRLEDLDGTCEANPESGSVVWTCSSDMVLKTDIKEVPDVFNYFEDVDVKEYEVLASGDKHVGVIAQEVNLTRPDLVHTIVKKIYGEKEFTNDDGGIETKRVVVGTSSTLAVEQPNPWVLFKAIQELREENLQQQAEIEALKIRMDLVDGLGTTPVEVDADGALITNELYAGFGGALAVAMIAWLLKYRRKK